MAEFILKDWYGKEQTFDHDKIFVKDTNGELIQFTQGEGDIPAVLQDKTITENGTYTADSGFDGLGSVLVEVAASGGNVSFYSGSQSLSGTSGEKISVDFGFAPDFMVVCPVNTLKNQSLFLGISEKLAQLADTSVFTYMGIALSSGLQGNKFTNSLNSTSSTTIYNVDQTGFYIGQPYTAGKYWIFALGL